MVAKINRGEQLFSAVIYNQHKVDAGTARIITGNRMVADTAGNSERQMQLTMLAFDNHLLANRNTEKPVLHISLNPSLDDTLSDEQFASLAKDYMQKMGYGKQPYIVYLHEDTGRRHIHIVSVCVDEFGRKIDDKYEWRRSMKVCRELERQYGLKNATDKRNTTLYESLHKPIPDTCDTKHLIGNILKALYSTYHYRSFGEWNALLSTFNIHAELRFGEFAGKPYNGIIYTITDKNGVPIGEPIKSSLIGKQFGYDGLKCKMARNARIHGRPMPSAGIRKSIALAIHGSYGNRDEFIGLLRNANIDVVFRENEDGRIYGVTFIDHDNRWVFNGSRLGKEFSANAFNRILRNSDFPETEYRDRNQNVADTIESAIVQAFGILSFGEAESGDTTDDIEEDVFAKKMRRKAGKRKQHSRGI